MFRAGRRIGKYEVLQHLATGGMAEVYLARAIGIEQFQKLCVIKRILPAAAGDPQLVRMLLDEARIAATLHHSNIVSVFDIGEADGEYFIAMEYLHGRDVHAVAKMLRTRGLRLAPDQAMTIILGICAGLHYAHEKCDDSGRPLGIVHRDVSPTNVLVTYDGGVKLVDFGLVKAEGRMTESRSGSLKGKLAYMSPEQCRSRPVDRRSDLFSLSIMLWELTTGQRLYKGESDYDYLTAIVDKEPTRPSEVVPEYPKVLEQIVMKGLSKDPAARYQNAEEMQLVLEEYCRECKLKVSPITLRRMMVELFGEERTKEGPAFVEEVMRSLASGSATVAGPRTSAPMQVPDTSPSINAMMAEIDHAPKKRRAAPWIAAIAGVAAAVIGGAYYFVGREPATAAVTVPAAATEGPRAPDVGPRPEVQPPAEVRSPKPEAPAAPEPEASKPAHVTTKHAKPPPPPKKQPEDKASTDHDSLFPE